MKKWLAVFILLIMSFVVVSAQDEVVSPTPTTALTSTPDIVGTAEAILARAEDDQSGTIDNVGSFMTTIQTWTGILGLIGVALTALFAVATYAGIRTSQQLTQQLEEARQKTSELEQLKGVLQDKQKQLDEQLKKVSSLPEEITQQMQAMSLVQFATRQLELGNRAAALATLKRAIKFDQDNPVTNYFLGEVYVREGDYEEGIKYLERSANDGTMPDAEATKAYAYRMMGDKDKARRDTLYSKAENLYTSLRENQKQLLDITGESVYGSLAGLYRNQGRYAKAIEIYEIITTITPNSSYPFNNLGLMHFQFDREDYADRARGIDCFKASREIAQRALITEPSNHWRWFDLITAEVALEEIEEAELQQLIDKMFNCKLTSDDLEKLVKGLEQLKASSSAPKLTLQALDYIQAGTAKFEA